MNSDFEYYWRVALLVLLVLSMLFLGNEFRKLDMEGIKCLKKPACPISLYQQEQEVGLAEVDFLTKLGLGQS